MLVYVSFACLSGNVVINDTIARGAAGMRREMALLVAAFYFSDGGIA